MVIETKFEMGQTVYGISNRPVVHWEPCGHCGGDKQVAGKDGVSRSCPGCYGRGGDNVYGPDQWQLAEIVTDSGSIDVRDGGPLHIRQVRVEITEPGFCWKRYHRENDPDKIQYMMEETGVGSGSLWDEWKLFLTREDAQAECDRRNAEAAQ